MRPFICLLFLACAQAPHIQDAKPDTDEGAYTSGQSTLLTFSFDSSFITASEPWNTKGQIQQQLFYTIGQLNGHNSVGRLDATIITNIVTSKQADGRFITRYHAALPVSWGSKKDLPKKFVFKLPKVADYEAFTDKYKDKCTEEGAHEVTSGSMWYYYRPDDCVIEAADVVSPSASISVSAENTTGKYPEYNKVWEDNAFNVVGIFGKYEDGATTNADAGISAYETFVEAAKQQLGSGVKVEAKTNDVTLSVTRADGKRIVITALQVDNPLNTGADFDARYNALSAKADLITYNGHAGLGSNVRALAEKGVHMQGQYQIVFMNGCDTFAYVDGALAQKKAAANPDDPKGTKYLDMVTNGMPAFFQSMPDAMLALVSALSNPAAPKTYEKIFADVDRSQFVVATGEEDNVYTP